jgi:hypothetical protein
MPNHPLSNANASWADAIAGAVRVAQQQGTQNQAEEHAEYMRKRAQRAAEDLGGLQGKRNR